jgi:hypothetical protein
LCDEAPSSLFPIVVVETEGTVEVEDLTFQEGSRTVALPVNHAKLEGPSFAHPTGFIGDWQDETTRLTWGFRLKSAGTYSIRADHVVHRKLLHQYNKPEVNISLGGELLKARVKHEGIPSSGKAYHTETLAFGDVYLEQGDHTLTLWGDDFGAKTARGFRLTDVQIISKTAGSAT